MASSLQSSLHFNEDEVNLPVVDISQFVENVDGEGLNHLQNGQMIATVREACKEWGFFLLVNHGIPVNIVQEMDSQVRQLCAMPAEVKKGSTAPNRTFWNESFQFFNVLHSNSIGELSNKIWPHDGNPKFCEAIRTYTLHMADLVRKIVKIILASLDLDIETFYHSDFGKFTASLRINHYEPKGISIGEEILMAHSDIGCLTILYQDNQGGLQIRSREGKWLSVNPIPNSFVINIGDCMK
ncbi:hypothetical protein KI387_026124, partial [Taxus chinensis]